MCPVQEKVVCIETLPVKSEADIYAAVGQGRMLAGQAGFDLADQTRLETIIAELARNALRYGGGGQLTLRCLERDGAPPFELTETCRQVGLEVLVEDQGPGIADLAQALAGGRSAAGGLGTGLPAVRRLADELAIDSAPGRGTRVRACKWARVPLRSPV